MPTALITGGLGFIGSFIARSLVEQGIADTIVCLDHFGRYVDSTRAEFNDYRAHRVAGIEGSIVVERGEAKLFPVLLDVVERHRPELIFHLAALPLAKLANLTAQEAMEGTVESTSNLIEAIAYLSTKTEYMPERVVYTSSSMIYGDFESDVATEDHRANPKEAYGTMKLAGEVVTRGLATVHGIPFSIVRPSAVYGPTDMNRRVSQIFVEKALLGDALTVNGATEKLDFTYVRDVARGFIAVATHIGGIGETFNITQGGAHTLIEYVECLRDHFPDLRYDVVDRDESKPHRGTLSIDKARRLVGYEPRYTLATGVAEYAEFVKQHHQLQQQC